MAGSFHAAAFDEYAFDVDYSSSSALFLSIAGTQRATGRADENAKVLYGTLTVVDILNETPNTCAFRAKGFTPAVGQRVIVSLGGATNPSRLFAGTILSCRQASVGVANSAYDVSCADDTWKLGQVKVSKRYTSQSATDIATDLIDTYAPDFATTDIEAALDDIDEITFTNETLTTCFTRLADRIGAYWYVDEFESLHFFVTDTATDPDTLDASNPPLADDAAQPFTVDRDLSQMVTRILGEGAGSEALAAISAGDTRIPIASAEKFNAGGGIFVSGPQRCTYTGLIEGGTGGVVGPGASPTSLLTLTGEFGTALDASADYDYAYTFVTGAGESLPSPLKAFNTSQGVASPTASWSLTAHDGTPIFGTGLYVYGISWQYPGTLRSSIGSLEIVFTNATRTDRIDLAGIPQPADPEATHINIWRSTLGGYVSGDFTSLKLVTTLAVGTTTYGDTTVDGSLGASGHTSPTAVCREVRVTNIPAGQSGVVTGRNLWRTEGGGSQLKKLATIADNTTDEFEDDIADGSLGANIHITDTSGLTQPTGTVPAGSTSLIVVGDFPDDGWAIVGNQVIRYTGRSASALTGIPATGSGSLAAAVGYNVTCVSAPQLIGIPSSGDGELLYDIGEGDPVNLFIIEDDLAAQQELIDAIGSGDGVVEEFIQDRRLTETELRARAVAILAQRARVEASIAYAIGGTTDPGCRDHRSGRSIVVDLADMDVSDTFRIQRVRISNFQPALEPIFDVEASTSRFSFEDLLRVARSTAT